MDVKTAINSGDAATLQRLLSEDSSRANELIRWGKCVTHPLHYISDMLFAGALQKGKELPLVEALVQAGKVPPIPIEHRPADQASAALADLKSGGKVRGRVVLHHDHGGLR